MSTVPPAGPGATPRGGPAHCATAATGMPDRRGAMACHAASSLGIVETSATGPAQPALISNVASRTGRKITSKPPVPARIYHTSPHYASLWPRWVEAVNRKLTGSDVSPVNRHAHG